MDFLFFFRFTEKHKKNSPPSGRNTHLQHIDQDHRIGYITIELLLLGSVGQVDQSPSDNPGPAIEEELEVEPLSDAWIELDAHHEVVKEVSCEFATRHKSVSR